MHLTTIEVEFLAHYLQLRASQVVLVVKNLPANAEDGRDPGLTWIGKIPWRRAWQPAPGFLPGEYLRTEESGGLQSIGLQRVEYG